MASRYLPYIHNQEDGGGRQDNPDEIQRNREFLALQNMLPVALQRTQAEETGKNALIRFAAVTEEEIELSN